MEWRKLGLIWAPSGEVDWARTHATLPVVQTLSDDRWRIFVSTRDAQGKSRIGRLTVDVGPLAVDQPPRVVDFDPTPVLSLGEPGTFDDSGVMPSWLVRHDDELRLYYIGWNVLGTIPYRLTIGLAVSEDGGGVFHRYSSGPLIDRSVQEPFFATAPCVLQENGVWRMWYVSCTGWVRLLDRWEPTYHVKYAESQNGVAWNITGISCLDAGPGLAAARPCVFRRGEGYGMIYSYRSLLHYRTDPDKAYRFGYAESADGVQWNKMDHLICIERSETGWDSEMLTYGWLHQQGNATYLLYNGNGFGRSGIGIAKLIET